MRFVLSEIDLDPLLMTSKNDNFDTPATTEPTGKRRRKRNTKHCSNIIRQLCASYAVEMEQAMCRIKGSRKMLYILSYGTVDSEYCMQYDRGNKVLIPSCYTVAFEAFGQVWIARTRYEISQVKQGLDDNRRTLYYEFLPVDDDGNEDIQYSSGFQKTATTAFKCALENKWGAHANESLHRPNGRLCIGVYYPAVQERMRYHFKQHVGSPPMSRETSQKLLNWLEANISTPAPSVQAAVGEPSSDAPLLSAASLSAIALDSSNPLISQTEINNCFPKETATVSVNDANFNSIDDLWGDVDGIFGADLENNEKSLAKRELEDESQLDETEGASKRKRAKHN